MERQLAQQLLAVSKRIWVRTDLKRGHPNRGIGVLIGVDGRCGIVHPANGHKKDEHIPLEQISLWKSRHPEFIGLIQAEEPMNEVAPELEQVNGEPTVPVHHGSHENVPVVAPPTKPDRAPEPQPRPAPILAQIQTIIEMQSSLMAEARGRVDELLRENEELQSLISANATEINQLEQFLNVPCASSSPTPALSVAPASPVSARISLDIQILDLLKQRQTWTRAEDIRASLGVQMPISGIMKQLLEEGRVVSMGEKRGRSYRTR